MASDGPRSARDLAALAGSLGLCFSAIQAAASVQQLYASGVFVQIHAGHLLGIGSLCFLGAGMAMRRHSRVAVIDAWADRDQARARTEAPRYSQEISKQIHLLRVTAAFLASRTGLSRQITQSIVDNRWGLVPKLEIRSAIADALFVDPDAFRHPTRYPDSAVRARLLRHHEVGHVRMWAKREIELSSDPTDLRRILDIVEDIVASRESKEELQ